jgi:hypothetical protein
MIRRLKFTVLVLALGALETLAVGCGATHASMRFVHASPDAPNVDLVVDGKAVATNLPFAGVSPASGYLTIAAGGRLIEVRPTGSTTDLVDSSNVSFSSHQQYTVFFTGLVNATPPNQTINLVTDDNSAPQSGNIKLRVFHASPSGPSNLDIYIVAPGTDIANLSPTIPGLAYQQASSYQSVAPTSNEVIMTASGDPAKNPVIDQTYALTAGQVRTLVVLDVTGGGAIFPTPLVLADLN